MGSPGNRELGEQNCLLRSTMVLTPAEGRGREQVGQREVASYSTVQMTSDNPMGSSASKTIPQSYLELG